MDLLYFVGYQKDYMIRTFVLSDIERITGYGYLHVSGQTELSVTWVGLWTGQISFIVVSLYILLGAYKLTVIIMLIVK